MLDLPIKIGCIGCGWIIEQAHIPVLMKLEDVRLTAVFDADLIRAQVVAERFGIDGIYNDIEALLSADIDAVIIATPNFTHADYVMAALERGLHVLCEKPVALNVRDVAAMIDAAQANGVIFFPGFVNRFRNDIAKLREMVECSEIGEITHLDAGWLRRSGVPRPGTWFTHKTYSGGGVLIDLGSHIIDICLMLLGNKLPTSHALTTFKLMNHQDDRDAKWFTANYANKLSIDVEDTARARISFEDGVLLTVNLSWKAPVEGDCTYFTLYGTRGSIYLKTLFGFSTDRLWEHDSLVIARENDQTISTKLDKNENNARNAFAEMLKAYVDAIKGEPLEQISHHDAYKTVEMIERLYANAIVQIDETVLH